MAYIDVSLAPYSASKLGTADARAAFVSADGAGGTLYVPRGTYRIDSDLTLSSDIHFEEGAVLRPGGSTVDIVLNGNLDAGCFQVFDIKTNAGSTVTPKKAEQVIPQWWGATGDGTTDDIKPINAALAAVRQNGQYGTTIRSIVFFPPGVYRVTQPLNCTGNPYNLKGSGSFQTIIRGETGAGKAIIELVGSTFCTIQDLMLDTARSADPQASITNASTVGILMARIKYGAGLPAQAGNFNFIDFTVSLHSDSSANGGNGTVAYYDYGAEVCDVHGGYLRADTAVVYTGNNLYSLDSVYQPQANSNGMYNSEASMTVCTIGGSSSLISYAGPALRINGAACIHVDAFLGCQAATPYPYAVEVLSTLTDFQLAGSAEGYSVMIRNRAFISGLRLTLYGPVFSKTTYLNPGVAYPTTTPVILLDPDDTNPVTIANSVIDFVPTPDTYQIDNYLIDQAVDPTTGATAAACSVYGCQLNLHRGDVRIRNPWGNSELKGNLMISERTLASVTLTAPVQSGNVIVAADKTSASGVVLDAGKLGVGNSASGTTLGSVVKKIEVFNASGASLGFVPVYNSIT
jgi:hypothetical protein